MEDMNQTENALALAGSIGGKNGLNCIAEFDSRTLNLGFIASVWDNRFEAMFELQNFQWINFGLRYKLRIKK